MINQPDMAFVGHNELTKLLNTSGIVSPLDCGKIKNGAYELSLGSQVFQTGSKPKIVKNLENGEKICIEPGQFALLLTKETVDIPKDKIGFISIKARIKFQGLINVSGFHVDPNFKGQLLFSVYNAGPSSIFLSQGTSYFPLWLSELGESQQYSGSHNCQNQIPDDPIAALSQGEIASPNELSKRINENKHLKTKIEWAVLAILAFMTGLTIKVWSDHSGLQAAIEYGYNKRIEEVASDSISRKNQKEILLLNTKIDSLLKVLSVKDTKGAK